MPFFGFFDPAYFIVLSPALILMVWAQYKVKSAFGKYSKVDVHSGLTGAETAAEILRSNGISDVHIESAGGFLSDHYDPSKKVLRLSRDVYGGRSQASVGVAAHEVGHALQHAQGYAPLQLRTGLVPVVQLGSYVWMPLLLAGMFLGIGELAIVGVVAFAGIALFQLVTLPVEFNASKRAMVEVARLGIVTGPEATGAKAVLDAAALTYVAAAIQSVLTVVYYLMRLGFLGGGDD